MNTNYYIKTNRVFTNIRKYGYLYTLLIAIGGLWYPKLGVSVLAVIAVMTGIALFKGRYWCGNFCSHGSLFDSVLMKFSRNSNIPNFLKSRLIAIPFFLAFGYKLTTKFIMVSALFGSMKFWDKMGFIFVSSYLMVLVAGSILSLVFSPRSWCNVCPMGTLQKLSYSLGKLLRANKRTDEKITVAHKEMCHKCGKCSRVCPMQLQPFTEFSTKNQFNHSSCIRCSTCVENCPAAILSLNNEEKGINIHENIDLEGYMERQRVTAVISKVIEIDEVTREYSFLFKSPSKVEYMAGQFILLKIQDDPEIFRAYSISSSSVDNTGLSVTIRKVPNGYGSEMIFSDFHPGKEVVLEGPMGRELVIDENSEKLLFIAGGIGITPFVPMVQNTLEAGDHGKKVELIYGVNKQSEFLYDNHFSRIDANTPGFNYNKVVAFDNEWQGEKGFVTDILKKMDLQGYKAYLCGPKPMIDAAIPLLREKGLKEEDIFFESA
jgi:NAD(P)H-flavin reductase/NAD-dependent dihydropyrimidine dehydrogenase PreA subunit